MRTSGNIRYNAAIMRSELMRWRLRRTTIISVGCAMFLSGLGLARLGLTVPMVAAAGSLGLLFLCVKRIAWLSIIAALSCGLLLGLGRGGEAYRSVQGYDKFLGQ